MTWRIDCPLADSVEVVIGGPVFVAVISCWRRAGCRAGTGALWIAADPPADPGSERTGWLLQLFPESFSATADPDNSLTQVENKTSAAAGGSIICWCAAMTWADAPHRLPHGGVGRDRALPGALGVLLVAVGVHRTALGLAMILAFSPPAWPWSWSASVSSCHGPPRRRVRRAGNWSAWLAQLIPLAAPSSWPPSAWPWPLAAPPRSPPGERGSLLPGLESRRVLDQD